MSGDDKMKTDSAQSTFSGNGERNGLLPGRSSGDEGTLSET